VIVFVVIYILHFGLHIVYLFLHVLHFTL